ncbi:spore cortex-lytic enzyme [Alicyclobacillus sacchari]|nr:spore cortex-lytic enzyme [Alicyclobacillus sacchari]
MRSGFRSLQLGKWIVFTILTCALTMTSLPSQVKAFTARNLIYGSEGYDVNELQGRLHLLGYYWGKNDGIFGWKTYWAVRTFQYNFGLPVTGDVDMATKQALVKATPNWNYHMDSNGGTNTVANQEGTNGGTNGLSPATVVAGDGFSHGSSGLSASDLNLMAHVVYGEARGEPFEGQVAIAAVILNRLHDPKFPKTIPAIVYAPGAFDCVNDGQINLQPNAEARRAVADAVAGGIQRMGRCFISTQQKQVMLGCGLVLKS